MSLRQGRVAAHRSGQSVSSVGATTVRTLRHHRPAAESWRRTKTDRVSNHERWAKVAGSSADRGDHSAWFVDSDGAASAAPEQNTTADIAW